MKRFVFIMLAMLTMATSSSAQEIYYEIKHKAQANVSDPSTNALIKQFSLFKIEALNYLAIKMKEEMRLDYQEEYESEKEKYKKELEKAKERALKQARKEAKKK